MSAPLLTAPEVAERLKLTTDSVYALARRGEIPHLRFGRSLRFRTETIDEWLFEREQATNDRRNR